MEEKRNDRWFLVSAGCIAVSILTLFLPIITYSEKRSGASVRVYRYAIQDFIFNGKSFADRVLWHYTGPVLWDIGAGTVLALALLFVVSIGLALAGILTMRTQYPNRRQFALTIAGLAGTAFPSLLVLLAVPLSGKYFAGTIRCGIAPILTPAAMILCMITVSGRRKYLRAERKAQKEAEGLIWEAGELPDMSDRWNRQ